MRTITRWLAVGLAFGATAAAALPAAAQDVYPSRFVRIVTTTGTGTGPDVITRVIAEALSREWGQQVIVENNSTGGGMVATKVVASAPPDGYVLLGASASTFNVLPIRQPDAPAVVGTHLKSMGYFGDQPLVIGVAPSLGVSSIKELVDLAKKDPDKILYAANVSGTLPHMTGELLKARTNAPYRFVPYRGGAEGLKDFVSGSVNMIIDGFAALEGTIASGHIKPIAVTSKGPLPNLPGVPPVGDTVPGFVSIGWNALMAPIGVPDAIVQKVNGDMRKVSQKPEVVKRLADLGAYPVAMTSAELDAFIKSEQQQWWPLVRQILSQPSPEKK